MSHCLKVHLRRAERAHRLDSGWMKRCIEERMNGTTGLTAEVNLACRFFLSSDFLLFLKCQLVSTSHTAWGSFPPVCFPAAGDSIMSFSLLFYVPDCGEWGNGWKIRGPWDAKQLQQQEKAKKERETSATNNEVSKLRWNNQTWKCTANTNDNKYENTRK